MVLWTGGDFGPTTGGFPGVVVGEPTVGEPISVFKQAEPGFDQGPSVTFHSVNRRGRGRQAPSYVK